jgi:hypothetical protein
MYASDARHVERIHLLAVIFLCLLGRVAVLRLGSGVGQIPERKPGIGKQNHRFVAANLDQISDTEPCSYPSPYRI